MKDQNQGPSPSRRADVVPGEVKSEKTCKVRGDQYWNSPLNVAKQAFKRSVTVLFFISWSLPEGHATPPPDHFLPPLTLPLRSA